ncbi:MAG: DUF6702 family protein [Bacteroidota bacterium]
MKWLILLGVLVGGLHPFHLSVSEINENKEANTLEISMRLFIDDMEEGLKEAGYGGVKLGSNGPAGNSSALLYKYIQDNFELKVNDEAVAFNFLGAEYEFSNVMWCYLEVENVKDIKKIGVRNHILTEVFSDQQNIVHVRKEGKLQSLRLRKGNDQGELTY